MRTRQLLPLVALLVATAAAHAQKTVTVSQPKKDATETFTMGVKTSGGNTITVTVTVPVKAAMTPTQKAAAIAKEVNKQTLVKATPAGPEVKIESRMSFNKLRTLSKTNNSQEPNDRIKAAASDGAQGVSMSCVAIYDGIVGVDADGAPSVLRVGTARGTVEVLFADVAGVEEAVSLAAEGLADLGVPVTMSDPSTFGFPIDAELDAYALYGCTEPSALQTVEIADVDD